MLPPVHDRRDVNKSDVRSLLLSPRLGFDPALLSRHSLVVLVAVAVTSTAVVATSYVAMLVAFGVLRPLIFGVRRFGSGWAM